MCHTVAHMLTVSMYVCVCGRALLRRWPRRWHIKSQLNDLDGALVFSKLAKSLGKVKLFWLQRYWNAHHKHSIRRAWINCAQNIINEKRVSNEQRRDELGKKRAV